MNSKVEATLTTGPIGKTLTRMTIPLAWGLLAIFSFNLVDTYFVAQLGTEELAAVSFTFPVVMILMNVALGLSIGTASVISRAIGQENHGKVKRLTTDSLILAFAIVITLACIGYSTITPLFSLLGAPDSLLPLIRSYMEIWYIGIPFIVIPMVGNGAIRASGDTKFPGMIMCFAAILNIVLDPLLIFGLLGFPRLEIQGAALATVIAYGSTFVATLWVLEFRKGMLTYQIKLQEMISSWKETLHIGIPAATTQMIVPFTSAITIWMLAHFDTAVVAAYGVVSRVEAFSLVLIIALSSSLGPFIGQNWGANKFDRVKQALRIGYFFSLAWGLGIAIALALGSTGIPSLFNPDPSVVSTASSYLLTVPITYGTTGIVFLTNAFLNAIGQPIAATTITILRFFILYIPMAYVAMQYFGPAGIFFSIAVSNVLVGTGAFFWSQNLKRFQS